MPAGGSVRDAGDILIERAMRDFDEGLAHARSLLRERHGRAAGAALDAVVTGAVRTLDLRGRLADDVRFLLDLARRSVSGEDPARLAEENLSRVLRLDLKMRFLARQDDPAFQDMLAHARAHMAARLPDLGRMALVEGARDYDDLLLRAFPEVEEVRGLVASSRAFALGMLDRLERNPHVLRVPRSLLPRIVHTAREMLDWQTEKVLRAVDDLYLREADAAPR